MTETISKDEQIAALKGERDLYLHALEMIQRTSPLAPGVLHERAVIADNALADGRRLVTGCRKAHARG